MSEKYWYLLTGALCGFAAGLSLGAIVIAALGKRRSR